MASDEVLLKICTYFLNKNLGESDKITYEKCFTMKDHVGVLINELKSARLMIKIFSLSLSLSLQRRYSPGWALASFKSFLHPSQFRATIFQFLHPSLATSSSTPFSQRSLGLPLGCFPPGSLRRTLLDKSSLSWHMTCPAHLSLLSLQNFTM